MDVSHKLEITRKLSNSSKTGWRENPGGLEILIYADSAEALLCARVMPWKYIKLLLEMIIEKNCLLL